MYASSSPDGTLGVQFAVGIAQNGRAWMRLAASRWYRSRASALIFAEESGSCASGVGSGGVMDAEMGARPLCNQPAAAPLAPPAPERRAPTLPALAGCDGGGAGKSRRVRGPREDSGAPSTAAAANPR